MDIRAALNEYDAMLGKKPIGEVETFLNGKIAQARTERDFDALFAHLNEYVGLSRNLRKREECLAACDELLLLADQIHVPGIQLQELIHSPQLILQRAGIVIHFFECSIEAFCLAIDLNCNSLNVAQFLTPL